MFSSTTSLVNHNEFPITLLFSQDDPTDSVITLDDELLYTIKTRRELVRKLGRDDLRTTTDVSSASGELLASFEWHTMSSDILTWPSRGMLREKANRWLKKDVMPFSKCVLLLSFISIIKCMKVTNIT